MTLPEAVARCTPHGDLELRCAVAVRPCGEFLAVLPLTIYAVADGPILGCWASSMWAKRSLRPSCMVALRPFLFFVLRLDLKNRTPMPTWLLPIPGRLSSKTHQRRRVYTRALLNLGLHRLGLSRLISSHTILFNLPIEHYSSYQPNRLLAAAHLAST
jgi:hypothetical protein